MNEADKRTESMPGFYPMRGEVYRFDMPLKDFEEKAKNDPCASWCHIAYLLERCRRAEALADSQALEIERLKQERDSYKWERT